MLAVVVELSTYPFMPRLPESTLPIMPMLAVFTLAVITPSCTVLAKSV